MTAASAGRAVAAAPGRPPAPAVATSALSSGAARRILHVTDSYLPTVGGIEIHVGDLAGRQAARGHRVEVLTRSSAPTFDDCLVYAVGPDPTRGSSPRPCRLPALLDAVPYDAVHVHASVYSPLAWRATVACARQRTPVVFTAHSLLTGVTGPYRVAARSLGLRRLPVVWSAVSRAAARSLCRAFAVDEGVVRVLPNAVDPGAWRPAALRPPHETVTFVAVMRLAARKRPLALLHAFHRSGVSRSARLVVVGDGPRAAACRRWCRRHPDADVVLLGRQDRRQIAAVLAAADVFVAPATRESFGIAALEARESGLAVIARSGTGVADFVTDGVHGLLVDDDAAMAAAICALATDGSLLQRLAAGAEAQRTGYDWTRALALAEHAYEDASALSARMSRR